MACVRSASDFTRSDWTVAAGDAGDAYVGQFHARGVLRVHEPGELLQRPVFTAPRHDEDHGDVVLGGCP
jgi:hypothetical protein